MASENTTTQRRTTSSSDAAAPSSTNPPHTSTTGGSSNSSTIMLPFRILSKTPAIITILLRVLLWPLFKLVNLAFPPKEFDGINNSTGSDRAARAFVTMFQKQISLVRPVMPDPNNSEGGATNNQEHYVEPACPFSSRGYNLTLSDITSRPPNSRPLLLLYLHSPLHADGSKFLREYLCHSQLLQLLNSNNSDSHGSVVCFGASIHTADGQRMRDMLGVTSFPFMALLSVKSSGSSSGNGNNNNGGSVPMELLLRMEGPQLVKIPPAQITTYLNTTITRQAEVLAAEEARRLQREEEQHLRREQDREFQETLLADQMREIAVQEAAEQERREQEEKEEEERLKKAKEESRLEDARAMLESAGEPPAGSKGVARMRFAFPNGKKVDRRFHTVDTIETVRSFLIVHFHEQGIEMKNFGLSTNFPRKTFNEEEGKLTLEEAGLAPQAVIMVQDLDS
mmetsp:Transcript_1516/g.2762  ORF Transcript_1516/g.2762 Transcript_1516/m.2762 type:complete len:453 (+) Transcript_1516:123-1481(+)